MYRNRFLSILLVSALAITASAQSLWTSVGGEHNFNKKLALDLEAEYRFSDGFSTTERFAVGADVEYKFCKFLKASVGYKFIRNNNPETTTEEINMKLNGVDYDTKEVKQTASYWDSRHRAFASVTGDIDFGHFNVSLREMYQYTHINEASAMRTIRTYENFDNVYDGVPVWYDDPDDPIETKPKVFKAKDKHILRSRLKVDYSKKKFPLSPYASVEFFNDLSLKKTRFSIGTDWKINKKHTLGLSYFYQAFANDDDDDELGTHVISLDYKIKF